ncbi:MAG: hypothetical protein AB2809_13675 [Candidatus Thiodiazotropha sp.]
MGDYSNSIRNRIVNRGPAQGYCVICGEYGKLTRDHVPPKRCNNLNDIEIKALMSDENSDKAGPTSQGGMHFKTLCGVCNSERLGIKYDPSLVDLSNEITSLVQGAKRRNIVLPKKIYPIIQPQRIARSVVGHALAAIAVDETREGLRSSPISDLLRYYFLDEESHMPDNLEIYYWLYPSRKQVVIKGMGKRYLGIDGVVVGHVLKFLPLGFWIVYNKPSNININLANLVKRKDMGLSEREQIEIDLYSAPSIKFPEAPKGWEINALNNSYAYSGHPKN